MTLEQLLAYYDSLLQEESKQVTEPMQINEERWKEADALVTESVKLECKIAPSEQAEIEALEQELAELEESKKADKEAFDVIKEQVELQQAKVVASEEERI